MLEAPLYSRQGARAGAGYALPAGYFDGTVHEPVLHQAVKTYLGNQRQGTAATKNRKRVSGGNQKPWRQKGTGRARQGSIRAPHWRGGGVVFGPAPRDYRTGIPVKVRRLARRSALNARAREGALFVIEPLAFEAPKTRELAELLGKLGLAGRKTVLLTNGVNRNLYLSGRNLPRTVVLPFAEATAYHVLWSDVVVVERGVFDGEDGGPEREGVTEGEGETAAAPKARKPRAAKPRAPSRKPAATKAAPGKAAGKGLGKAPGTAKTRRARTSRKKKESE